MAGARVEEEEEEEESLWSPRSSEEGSSVGSSGDPSDRRATRRRRGRADEESCESAGAGEEVEDCGSVKTVGPVRTKRKRRGLVEVAKSRIRSSEPRDAGMMCVIMILRFPEEARRILSSSSLFKGILGEFCRDEPAAKAMCEFWEAELSADRLGELFAAQWEAMVKFLGHSSFAQVDLAKLLSSSSSSLRNETGGDAHSSCSETFDSDASSSEAEDPLLDPIFRSPRGTKESNKQKRSKMNSEEALRGSAASLLRDEAGGDAHGSCSETQNASSSESEDQQNEEEEEEEESLLSDSDSVLQIQLPKAKMKVKSKKPNKVKSKEAKRRREASLEVPSKEKKIWKKSLASPRSKPSLLEEKRLASPRSKPSLLEEEKGKQRKPRSGNSRPNGSKDVGLKVEPRSPFIKYFANKSSSSSNSKPDVEVRMPRHAFRTGRGRSVWRVTVTLETSEAKIQPDGAAPSRGEMEDLVKLVTQGDSEKLAGSLRKLLKAGTASAGELTELANSLDPTANTQAVIVLRYVRAAGTQCAWRRRRRGWLGPCQHRRRRDGGVRSTSLSNLRATDLSEHERGALMKRVIMELRSVHARNAEPITREVCRLCRHMATHADDNMALANAALVGVAHAVGVMRAIYMDLLTPAHVDFVQLCLVTKRYRLALRVLETRTVDAVHHTTGLDVQRYFYYGGRVFTGLKRFEEALDMFKLCFATPTQTMSKVVLRAYQHACIVSLLQDGQKPEIPHSVAAVVRSALSRSEAIEQLKPYQALVASFGLGVAELRAALNKHKKALVQDDMWGLCKQLETARIRQRIKTLRHTYITLNLDDMAALVVESPTSKTPQSTAGRGIGTDQTSAMAVEERPEEQQGGSGSGGCGSSSSNGNNNNGDNNNNNNNNSSPDAATSAPEVTPPTRAEMEAHIEALVAAGEIDACVDPVANLATFKSGAAQRANAAGQISPASTALNTQVTAVEDLLQQIARLDQYLATRVDVVDALTKPRGGADSGGPEALDGIF
ncbi:COP9 signalosome complex subunit 3 (Signalosome subunit 3) [Durusdinium trenchii]|uniref:COP9 signalosome complex subunit 3 (Signalosome subunit 3) n=1 Tax=Durusdinium trenchii TaxID=1381693 RepID=A0ABP0RP82_9DINO